jgi:hypothetical protein
VRSPDTDDYKKLAWIFKYLRGAKDMVLNLKMNDIKWWVDAPFARHNDMRRHTRGLMTLGRGAVYATYTR